MAERGATRAEVVATVNDGETFPAKFGRTGFRRNFTSPEKWQERLFATKQIEAYAVQEGTDWVVITVITKYF
jgi:hypothetical protein